MKSLLRVLFNTYMNVGSSQFISFTSEIVEDINNIVLGEFKGKFFFLFSTMLKYK